LLSKTNAEGNYRASPRTKQADEDASNIKLALRKIYFAKFGKSFMGARLSVEAGLNKRPFSHLSLLVLFWFQPKGNISMPLFLFE
jgi:hypothetical protein